MAYANNPYILNIEKEFQALQESIICINQARLNNAHPLPEKAEQAHKEVLSKINTFIPGDSIDRRVLCNQFIDCSGCLVKLEDKKMHVVVRKDIAMFDASTDEYRGFAKKNRLKRTGPRDLFMNIVAHEYGHILFDSRLEHKIYLPIQYFESGPQIVPLEMDEAFAFWFGDTITGFKSPLDMLAINYKQQGVDFEKTIGIYQELNKLTRTNEKNAVFDPKNLCKIVLAMGDN